MHNRMTGDKTQPLRTELFFPEKCWPLDRKIPGTQSHLHRRADSCGMQKAPAPGARVAGPFHFPVERSHSPFQASAPS